MNHKVLSILQDQLAFLTRSMLCQKCLQISLLLHFQPVYNFTQHWIFLLASAQSVTCICTNAWPAATRTSCSKPWSPSTMAGSWISTWCTAPMVTLSRIDLTVPGLRQVVTWLNTSATMLSHPFWYSNWKLNLARAPTHRWPVALRLGVIIM